MCIKHDCTNENNALRGRAWCQWADKSGSEDCCICMRYAYTLPVPRTRPGPIPRLLSRVTLRQLAISRTDTAAVAKPRVSKAANQRSPTCTAGFTARDSRWPNRADAYTSQNLCRQTPNLAINSRRPRSTTGRRYRRD